MGPETPESEPLPDRGADLIEEFYQAADAGRPLEFEEVSNRVFSELQQLYGKKLLRVFSGHSLKVTPEDGAHETLLHVYRTKDRPGSRYRRGKGRFAAWLGKIARNVLLDNAIRPLDTDEKLIERICRGDKAAATEIKRRYRHNLQAFFLRELRRQTPGRLLKGEDAQLKQRAAELTAQTLSGIVRRAHEFNPQDKQFTVWLTELAREGLRAAKGWVAEYLPGQEVEIAECPDPAAEPRDPLDLHLAECPPVASQVDVEEALRRSRDTFSDKVVKAFDELSPLEQRAAVLVWIHDMSVQEAAEVLKTSSQAVFNALWKARKKMESWLRESGGSHDETD